MAVDFLKKLKTKFQYFYNENLIFTLARPRKFDEAYYYIFSTNQDYDLKFAFCTKTESGNIEIIEKDLTITDKELLSKINVVLSNTTNNNENLLDNHPSLDHHLRQYLNQLGLPVFLPNLPDCLIEHDGTLHEATRAYFSKSYKLNQSKVIIFPYNFIEGAPNLTDKALLETALSYVMDYPNQKIRFLMTGKTHWTSGLIELCTKENLVKFLIIDSVPKKFYKKAEAIFSQATAYFQRENSSLQLKRYYSSTQIQFDNVMCATIATLLTSKILEVEKSIQNKDLFSYLDNKIDEKFSSKLKDENLLLDPNIYCVKIPLFLQLFNPCLTKYKELVLRFPLKLDNGQAPFLENTDDEELRYLYEIVTKQIKESGKFGFNYYVEDAFQKILASLHTKKIPIEGKGTLPNIDNSSIHIYKENFDKKDNLLPKNLNFEIHKNNRYCLFHLKTRHQQCINSMNDKQDLINIEPKRNISTSQCMGNTLIPNYFKN